MKFIRLRIGMLPARECGFFVFLLDATDLSTLCPIESPVKAKTYAVAASARIKHQDRRRMPLF
jgi:hypothetical protein